MFDRRLIALLVLMAIAVCAIAARLVQLQVIDGDYYRAQAAESFLLRPESLPFVRGSIRDRNFHQLVRNEPCWDVKVDYAVFAADVGEDPELMSNALRCWRKRYAGIGAPEEGERAFRADIDAMWRAMAFLATSAERAVSVDDLRARAVEIHARVERIRAAVAKRRGFEGPVAEEQIAHAILPRLDAYRQIEAREILAAFPWVRIEPAQERVFAAGLESLAHVLGRVGRVDAATVANDPLADDPFASYRADETLGITGVEFAGESVLRGRRGQITFDREGTVVNEIPSEPGRDVTLTIHTDLQRRMYDIMKRAVRRNPASAGGAIVVLDVASREVLALVSYPGYDPANFDDLYARLRDDTIHLPLWFRAVASRYAPGSTIKPLACVAGLIDGTITTESQEECTGYLFADQRDRWRCWEMHGTSERKSHGAVNVTAALTGSCNIFMYRLGERLGVDRMCNIFDMAGVGRLSGIALREENAGINPTSSWLMQQKRSAVSVAHARLFAMGQGEISMTPLQVANMLAVYASGKFKPVTLIMAETPTPEWRLPVSAAQWHAVREGVYGVVNDREGTAYKYAHFENDRWALCGKTGSATAYPWPTAYEVPFVDAHGAAQIVVIPAGSASSACDRFEWDYPGVTCDRTKVEVAARWPTVAPESGDNHSHAWFGGFLQPRASNGHADWSKPSPIAFAVLVEFGGSGGQISGPLAKEVTTELLEVFGPDLHIDPARRGGGVP